MLFFTTTCDRKNNGVPSSSRNLLACAYNSGGRRINQPVLHGTCFVEKEDAGAMLIINTQRDDDSRDDGHFQELGCHWSLPWGSFFVEEHLVLFNSCSNDYYIKLRIMPCANKEVFSESFSCTQESAHEYLTSILVLALSAKEIVARHLHHINVEMIHTSKGDSSVFQFAFGADLPTRHG